MRSKTLVFAFVAVCAMAVPVQAQSGPLIIVDHGSTNCDIGGGNLGDTSVVECSGAWGTGRGEAYYVQGLVIAKARAIGNGTESIFANVSVVDGGFGFLWSPGLTPTDVIFWMALSTSSGASGSALVSTGGFVRAENWDPNGSSIADEADFDAAVGISSATFHLTPGANYFQIVPWMHATVSIAAGGSGAGWANTTLRLTGIQLLDNGVDITSRYSSSCGYCGNYPFGAPALTVTPEPATWTLLAAGLGLVGLGGMVRRRKASA